MATIWKFPFNVSDYFTVPMPDGAQILHVEAQQFSSAADGSPAIWALVDPDAPVVERDFCVFGTGHKVRPPGPDMTVSHVATWLHGPFVWHLFEATS